LAKGSGGIEMKMKAKLTDGRIIELESGDFNPFGQIYLSRLVNRGVAEDIYKVCELLGSASAEIRYGMVHPKVQIYQ
jgi:hypothetical protein